MDELDFLMLNIKPKRLESKKLRDSAKGEPCTLQIVGCCNYDPETTVLAHINLDGGKMGGKSDDCSGVFACSACHDAIDGRNRKLKETDRYYYYARGLARTIRRWIDTGVLVIK